jgi:hypothetical protein
MSFALLAFSRRGQLRIIRSNELLARPWPLPSYLGRDMSNEKNNGTRIIGGQIPFIPFNNCRVQTM